MGCLPTMGYRYVFCCTFLAMAWGEQSCHANAGQGALASAQQGDASEDDVGLLQKQTVDSSRQRDSHSAATQDPPKKPVDAPASPCGCGICDVGINPPCVSCLCIALQKKPTDCSSDASWWYAKILTAGQCS